MIDVETEEAIRKDIKAGLPQWQIMLRNKVSRGTVRRLAGNTQRRKRVTAKPATKPKRRAREFGEEDPEFRTVPKYWCPGGDLHNGCSVTKEPCLICWYVRDKQKRAAPHVEGGPEADAC